MIATRLIAAVAGILMMTAPLFGEVWGARLAETKAPKQKTQVTVAAVRGGSMATRVGLQQGDTILEVDGTRVTSRDDLTTTLNRLATFSGNSTSRTVKIKVMRAPLGTKGRSADPEPYTLTIELRMNKAGTVFVADKREERSR